MLIAVSSQAGEREKERSQESLLHITFLCLHFWGAEIHCGVSHYHISALAVANNNKLFEFFIIVLYL